MSIDKTANMFDGELAALQRVREMESLDISPVSTAIGKIADVISEFGVQGAGLFAKALESGQTPIEKVVEQLENGAYAEISRIWKHLEGRDEQLRGFDEQLKNQEAKSAYQGAILHGLRTSDPGKHLRIGALTINCIYTKELKPESFDGTMQAAVELRESDILFLRQVYELQIETLREAAKLNVTGLDKIAKLLAERTNNGEIDMSGCRGSVSRLQAQGFLQLRTPGLDAGAELVVLLHDGAKFYERLCEIDATK